MIKRLFIKYRQCKIAFNNIRKHFRFGKSLFLLIIIVYKSLIYYVFNYLDKNEKKINVELQLIPFIFLYSHLKKNLNPDKAKEIGGEILARCGALDIKLTIPNLRKNENLSDYINYLKKSKYFKLSSYNIIKEDVKEVKIKVTKCIYCELLKKYGVFELAEYLCKSDELFFKNYHPNIKFILNGSIAKGDKFCDETYKWNNS